MQNEELDVDKMLERMGARIAQLEKDKTILIAQIERLQAKVHEGSGSPND